MHDVFISYAAEDKGVADTACAVLERNGNRCWIAPRDAVSGLEWGGQLIRAINESALMVLVYSRNANASNQVKREVERAVAKGIPIIPFRIEDVPASETLEYFISTPHWMDALTPPMEKHLDKLASTVRAVREHLSAPGAERSARRVTPGPVPTVPLFRPRWLIVAAAAVVLVAGSTYVTLRGRSSGGVSWTGTWTTDTQLNGIPAKWQLSIARNSTYRISLETHDKGVMDLVERGPGVYTFTMHNIAGQRIPGTFRLSSDGTAVMSASGGRGEWRRASAPYADVLAPGGRWTSTAMVQSVRWALTMTIENDGAYQVVWRSEDEGRFSTSADRWYLSSTTGPSQQGTFARIDDRSVTMTGPLGTATWVKQ